MKKHNQALDNYLIANTYISKTDDKYLIYKVKYNIANIKYYLRFYDEAISLFTECIDYFKDNNTDGYLNSLHLLGLCYNRIGNYGLCTDVNKKGVLECKRLDNDEMLPYFIHSEGINQCFKNNYASAIAKINSSLPVIRKNKDFANEAVGYFYIGKSYWNLNKPETAVYYFKKVDAIFANKGYIRADLLQNYKLLMKYYKSKNNPEREHYYSGQLIKAYGILVNKFEYLSGRIHKEFDIKEVVLQNENIQKMLDNRKYNDAIFIVVVTFLFLSLLFFVYRHFKNKRVYKQKFEELMNKSVTNTKTEPKTATAGIEVVDEEKAAVILKQLKRFEDHKKFIGKDLTSIKLAVAFRCDPKYLSKIIFLYRGKKFKDYINDLKIDYVISLMKEDIKVSRYSNIALAEEGGFSRTKRFTNAFFSRTGMPTTYFANELAKGQAEL
jgi:tetratricopeptide (TPR) repeat protein/AraC-like DNA-binding protein